jgi:LmbE family N-acetylglucosaminyl deacetylase
VAARRAEDRAALALFGARPVWLDFSDPQYGPRPSPDALSEALERAILDSAAEIVFIPFGLFHGDHELTHAASLEVMRRRPGPACFAYEEPIYRRKPSLVEERLAALRRAGIDVRPAGASSERGREPKRRAVACYRSQLRALAISWDGGYADAFEPEHYWRLAIRGPTAARARPASEPHGR